MTTRKPAPPPTPDDAENAEAPASPPTPDEVDDYVAGRAVEPRRIELARDHHRAHGMDAMTRLLIDGGVR